MASITPRMKKDGSLSYMITISLGRDAEGRKIKQTATFTPKSKAPTKALKEAEAYAAKLEEQILSGDIVSGDRVTFAEFVEICNRRNDILTIFHRTDSKMYSGIPECNSTCLS